MDPGHRFRRLGLAGTKRDERLFRRGAVTDLLGLDLEQFEEQGRQLLEPGLRLGGESIEQLRGRRRRTDRLLREACAGEPHERPGNHGRLAHAVSRLDADPALAGRNPVQDLRLFDVGFGAEHFADEEHRVIPVSLDKDIKRVEGWRCYCTGHTRTATNRV